MGRGFPQTYSTAINLHVFNNFTYCVYYMRLCINCVLLLWFLVVINGTSTFEYVRFLYVDQTKRNF